MHLVHQTNKINKNSRINIINRIIKIANNNKKITLNLEKKERITLIALMEIFKMKLDKQVVKRH